MSVLSVIVHFQAFWYRLVLQVLLEKLHRSLESTLLACLDLRVALLDSLRQLKRADVPEQHSRHLLGQRIHECSPPNTSSRILAQTCRRP